MERPAFTRTRLDEERANDQSRTLSLKLNREEDAELEIDMRLLDIGVDSAAVKMLMGIGRKVIREQIPGAAIKYLVSRDRIRYDGRKRR